MDSEQELKALLNELSAEISRSLSTPEMMAKLDKLQQNGYELYLILEPSDEDSRRLTPSPILPLQIGPHSQGKKKVLAFNLTDEDKDFLRTLKIKVD